MAGTSIPHYRDRKGLTQLKLAQAIGIDEAVMSKIENGIVVPTPEQVDAIAEKLDAQPTLLWSKGMLAVVAERARETA
jgi:transcriptional regulator with XRE-family HTH domain